MARDQAVTFDRQPARAWHAESLLAFGQAVRRAREDLGLTVGALAVASGVGEKTIRRLQSGQTIDLSHLLAVVEVLGLQLSVQPPRWHERINLAVARYCGADWLLQRPSLSATEAGVLAKLLTEQLRADPPLWHGTAKTMWTALRDKLRRMEAPKKKGRP